MLKKMNSTYPKTTSDFDREFLSHLLKEVFTKKDLKESGRLSMIRNLHRNKLQLAKGRVRVWFNLRSFYLQTFIQFFCILAIYGVRVGDDKKRRDSFRQITINIGQSL